MKSSTKHLRLFMIALFTCIACVCLVFGVTACSGGKSSGAIDLSETNVTISVGETHTITATATEKNGGEYTGNYVWSCDGDAVSITSDGNTCIMTGVSAGKASITVTAGSYSVRCDVTVVASSGSTGTTSVETVSIEPDALKLYTGQSGTVSASLTVTGGTTYTGDYEWESSNVAVATVTKGENGSCTVTAVGAGTATITVTVGAEGAKKQATCTVTVEEDSIATLELSEEAIVVAEEGVSTLIVTVKMTSGESSTDFKAEIGDSSIATIEVSGNVITVTGVETGETKITVTAGSITKECTVTVKEPEIAEINLSKTSVTLGTNETATITVTVTLDNGKITDEYSASASCEPEDIVTANVANGILTITAGETEGGVKITVTIDGTTISAECSVTVADVQKEYSIDFSDPNTYAWIGTPDTSGVDESGESFMYLQNLSSTYTTGILTYVASGASVNKENAGALFTNTSSGTYFEIDLSAFEGFYVSIIVKMSTNSATTARSLYINTDKSTSSGLKSVTSSNKTDYQTLEYGKVISAGETLYLTWSGNIRIFTIEIEIRDAGDVTPEVREVTLDRTSLSLYVDETDYLTATVEMTIGDFAGTYEWSTSDETIVRVEGSGNGATVIAVSEGTATITVTAGGKSAECVVTVSAPDESVIERVYVDFGESSTYTWISSTIASGETYSDPLGILTLHAGGSTAISSDHLNTGGGSSSGNNRYFSIDLSGYIGYVFSIEVTMTSNSSEDRSVCLDTQYTNAGSTESNTTLAFATSSSVSDKQKLEYMAEITDANKTLYLTCDKSVNYYTIDIKILDPGAVTPEVQGVTLSDSVLILEAGGTGSLTATVKMNIGDYEGEYEWTSSDGGVVTVDGTSASPTMTAVGAGTATITVIVGGYSAECLVVVSAEGEEATYEWIYNEFDYARALSDNGVTATTESYTQGIFTVNAGANFEDEDFNTQKADVTMVLSGITNNIFFTAKGGSGSGNSVVKLYLVNEDGSRKDVTPSDWPVDGVAQNVSGDFTASGLIGGTYVITTSYTARIYSLKVEQFVAVSDPVGISATAGTVDFLKGRDVSVDDLKLNIMLDYENGRQDPLDVSNVTVSLVSSNLSVGRNEITITYYYTYEDDTGASNTKEFTTSVYIYVYSIDYLTISDFSMEKSSSTYITHNVQKVFLVGSEVNYDYAAVTATATCTYTDDDGKTVTLTSDFIMTEADGLVFSNSANTSVAGTYLVTATANMGETEGNSKTASYDIHVVDATGADITTVNVVHPTDNGDGAETEVATYAPDAATGIISVSTITDAIQLIKLMGATDAERKYIYVGEGQYWEKIYIDIPNLSLIGSNSSETDDLATRQETTEIVYWAYNGLMDPSGTTTFSTVGSATVTVANTATDFYAADITFRNYWNTNELYGECRTYTSDTQADAAYINADRAHFYNVTFTGYHDTLEAENGRQYYDHCYIEGRTDYIFGDTATCYFKDCTIHTIGADSSSNGGYVTAVKGGSMTYGYVFDGCSFTSDLKSYYTTGGGSLAVPYEGFAYTEEGTVSLGRTWNSSNMHVAVINSTLDAGYSKTAYGTSGKNPRYTDMSGYAPNPEYLVEYKNEGDGAITADLDKTCSMLSDEQAATYTIENIFAAENGGMSYNGSWDPSTEKTITVTVKDSTGADVTKIYATNSITVSNLMNAVNARLTDAEVEALYDVSGNEITGTISDSSTVYIATKQPDSAIKENLYYEYSDFAALTEEDDGTYSLGGITIDLGASGAFYSNNDDKWYVLTGTTTFTLQVKAGTFIDWWAYQDSTLTLKVNGTETSFTSTDTTSECLYTYRATEDAAVEIGVATGATAYVKYIAVNMMFGEGSKDLVSGWPDANYTIQSTVGYYSGIRVDASASGAKLSVNSTQDWLQINAGTTLTFSVPDGATVTATFYNQNTGDTTYYSIGDVTGGFCTISVLANTYISAITITVAG